MYTYSTKLDPYETYVLKHDATDTYIEVVPERGCIISKFVQNSEQIFYLEQETLEDKSKNIRGGNPILFPISSYLENETYHYEGKAYQLKQHGFARNLPGKVLEVQAGEEQASITLEITEDEETLVRFPFRFSLVMQYVLDGTGLTVKASVTNKDDKTMPFYLGYHPYFYTAGKQNLGLRIPSTNYFEMVPNSMPEGKFNFNQPESNTIYSELSSPTCEMLDYQRNLKISITSDKVYDYIVLWALEGKSFVCIEPWMAPMNGMNVDKGVQRIAAGETHTSVIQIQSASIS